MTAVAEEAGVATQTLYLSVGTKVQLLRAAIDVAVGGDETGALQQYGCRRCEKNPTGAPHSRMAVRAARRVYERGTPLLTQLQEAAADSEVAELQTSRRHRRSEFSRRSSGPRPEKEGFDPALSLDRAVDSVYALLSAETFRLLCIDRHWDGHNGRTGSARSLPMSSSPRTDRAHASSPASTRPARKRT